MASPNEVEPAGAEIQRLDIDTDTSFAIFYTRLTGSDVGHMSTQALRTHWPGWHYDGRAAKWEPVTVMIGAAGIGLVTEDGRVLFWPFEEIRQTRGASAQEPVRLEHGDEAPDAIVVDDPAFLPAVYAAAPRSVPQAARTAPTENGSAPGPASPPATSPPPRASR